MAAVITGLRFSNFRSYADSGRIPFEPLTLIIGPNNSGKSTIINSLLMIKQTLQEDDSNVPLITSGSYIDLGSFFDIVRGGLESEIPAFSISVFADTSGYGRRPLMPGNAADELSATFSFDRNRNQILVTRATTRVNGKRILEATEAGFTHAGITKSKQRHYEAALRHFIPVLKLRHWPKSESPKSYEVWEKSFDSDSQAMAWIALFNSLVHVAPLRSKVPFYGVLGRASASGVQSGGEQLIEILANKTDKVSEDKTLAELLNKWISENLGLLDKLEISTVDSLGRILSLVANERGGFSGINVAAMGEGVSQVLPIIVNSVLLAPNQTLLIEQPEIHLHPKAQSDLGDLFIDTVRQRPGSQIIVETHSEHILLRVRRRIAEGRINPGDVCLLFVEKTGGETRVCRLPISTRGEIERWPEGFFDEAYKEALELAYAKGDEIAPRIVRP
jgi:predicted ATPase